jgi:hypothetical protein
MPRCFADKCVAPRALLLPMLMLLLLLLLTLLLRRWLWR